MDRQHESDDSDRFRINLLIDRRVYPAVWELIATIAPDHRAEVIRAILYQHVAAREVQVHIHLGAHGAGQIGAVHPSAPTNGEAERSGNGAGADAGTPRAAGEEENVLSMIPTSFGDDLEAAGLFD